MSRTSSDEAGRMDRFFTAFSTLVAKWTESQKWTGSHWTFAIVRVLVVVSLIAVAVKDTNIGISIATLLMVFVLQNTQNGDSRPFGERPRLGVPIELADPVGKLMAAQPHVDPTARYRAAPLATWVLVALESLPDRHERRGPESDEDREALRCLPLASSAEEPHPEA